MRLSIKWRWIKWRNSVLGNRSFQRGAARFWLTRPVARARARAVFSLVAGFVYSQVTAAAVQTGLLDKLAAGPADANEIAQKTGLPNAGAERLLKAASSLGLAERFDETRFVLGSVGAALRADPGITAMISHHTLLYADLADPVALLQRGGGGGALSAFWPYAEAGNGSVTGYSQLMAASQPMVAAQAIAAFDFGKHRRLLDIGGGEGAFLSAVSAAYPDLETAVFDLPAVSERANLRGIKAFSGSFLTDSLPTGFDLLSLVRILHDHDDAGALQILRAAQSALTPSGELLIVEPMAGKHGDVRVGDAYFGFYLLAMGSGRARAPDEIRNLLKIAGFRHSRMIRTALPMIAQVIVAKA